MIWQWLMDQDDDAMTKLVGDEEWSFDCYQQQGYYRDFPSVSLHKHELPGGSTRRLSLSYT